MIATDLLCCPICRDPLALEDRSLRCPQNHSFDRARQGYFHLLPVQKKRSKNPGDDAAMVSNRRQFLDLGHYRPIAGAICEMIADSLTTETPALLDCGCGEGYYTRALEEHLLRSNGRPALITGLDISKDAARYACQRSRSISWIVASGADAPLPDHRLDGLCCLFTPFNPAEFHRLLKAGAPLLIASTGREHLIELRQQIYDEVRDQAFDPLTRLAEHFNHRRSHCVNYRFTLDNSDSIRQLLSMTPHQWRASAAAREKLSDLSRLELTVDVNLHLLTARP